MAETFYELHDRGLTAVAVERLGDDLRLRLVERPIG